MSEPTEDLVELLNKNGFKTVEGRSAVLAAIANQSDGSTKILCSGYVVFPNGKKCPGCRDCLKMNMREVI